MSNLFLRDDLVEDNAADHGVSSRLDSRDRPRPDVSVVFAKIGASSRTEAVAIALRKQLVKM